MSRETIIRHIVGRDLAKHDLSEAAIRQHDLALFELACEEFGSWETALQYAGVTARLSLPSDKRLPSSRVCQRLRRLCTTGYDLNAKLNRSRNPALYEAALHHFGTWRGALAAAGINLSNVSHRRPKHLDRETMILWLQQRQAAGQSLGWTKVCLENRDYALAIRREFQSWRKALQSAGVQSAK